MVWSIRQKCTSMESTVFLCSKRRESSFYTNANTAYVLFYLSGARPARQKRRLFCAFRAAGDTLYIYAYMPNIYGYAEDQSKIFIHMLSSIDQYSGLSRRFE